MQWKSLQTLSKPKLSFSHNIHDSLLVILADLIGIIGGYIGFNILVMQVLPLH
jgi:hypothetical protein